MSENVQTATKPNSWLNRVNCQCDGADCARRLPLVDLCSTITLRRAYGWNCYVVGHCGCVVALSWQRPSLTPNCRSFIQAPVHPTSLLNRLFYRNRKSFDLPGSPSSRWGGPAIFITGSTQVSWSPSLRSWSGISPASCSRPCSTQRSQPAFDDFVLHRLPVLYWIYRV